MFDKMKDFSIVKKFNLFATISLILCITGIVGVIGLPFGFNLFNFDIDFTGGTTLQYEMHFALSNDDLKDITAITAKTVGSEPSSVQKSGNNGTVVVIKTKTLDMDTRNALLKAVSDKYNPIIAEKTATGESKESTNNVAPTNANTTTNDTTATNDNAKATDNAATNDQNATTNTPAETAEQAAKVVTVLSVDNVDPVVGADLRQTALLATLVASILMLLYITIRFDFKSGVAAVVALLNDILVIISFVIIFRIPININFIAAILTILGFSINATIIIFDRIRENVKLSQKTSFSDIVDKSIWQTMGRTVNTNLTVLITLTMILIMGVDSVRNFAIPLTVGIVAGAYSSIFISGPLWAKLRDNKK